MNAPNRVKKTNKNNCVDKIIFGGGKQQQRPVSKSKAEHFRSETALCHSDQHAAKTLTGFDEVRR